MGNLDHNGGVVNKAHNLGPLYPKWEGGRGEGWTILALNLQ